jgi:uncharacterized protein YjbJ (UPF0337 family)
MKAPTRKTAKVPPETVKGDAKIIVGKLREALGEIAQNRQLRKKGAKETGEDLVKRKIGEVKKVFGL